MVLSTSCIIFTTEELSWLHDSIIWIKPCHWSTPSKRRYTTEICQEIPRLSNQSAWDSRYLCGRNFIPQSLTIKMFSSSSCSKASNCAWSWLVDLKMWHFQDRMARFAVWNRNTASSFSSSDGNFVSLRTRSISVRFSRKRPWHLSHLSVWSWSQRLLLIMYFGTVAKSKHWTVVYNLRGATNVNPLI